MSSGFPRLMLLAMALLAFAGPASARELRVCADPNNLPFSNDKGQGFENRIAEIVADELGARLAYAWWPQRRGFLRNTLTARLCDLVPGVPSRLELLRTTAPYYRSGYVFVTRAEDGLAIASLDDPALRTLRIGVQLIGDDGVNTPPAHALTRRGIVENVRGYTVYGNYAEEAPAAGIIAALARREVDVAIAWGPLAGYLASRGRLTLAPVHPEIDGPSLSMAFDISMGTRHEDSELAGEVDAALASRRADIDALLAEFGVPRLDGAARRTELPQ